ncbi:non-homologous end joining protein Ku [Legionella septentrionalis]|uniref:Non-homologous end joining protein Ku n=1 Tax=Legionella septentrionalis TaxID=2498109 RepID=A0A433JIH8_9GAMM|nr:Ku protein [Legionella septentrionalis]RUQ85087.1 Ku protein [Legionella septentrionalis]RUQ95170.1 Ku protein [Legionella septentrionalis]RUR08981.1 Ku protein [Legionella septentrionalis]RUR14878.1 Ku protein [Legionella septentrionalis]
MRPIWSGSISFGLVNIPVKLHSGTIEQRPELHLMRKSDGCPVKYSRVCRFDGKEVPMDEIVRGYKWKDGDYIVLEAEDFKLANAKKTQSIDIAQFVHVDEIDTIYFEKPYYLEPEKSGQKAYVLLRQALEETKTVGVGEFVLRNKEALVIIKPYGKLLVLEKLRYAADIRPLQALNLPSKNEITKAELNEGVKLINKMTKKFKPEQYHDDYIEYLRAIIAEKVKAKKTVERKKPSKKRAPEKVVDIMSLLKESLKNKAS